MTTIPLADLDENRLPTLIPSGFRSQDVLPFPRICFGTLDRQYGGRYGARPFLREPNRFYHRL
jgi:hypothetical protein